MDVFKFVDDNNIEKVSELIENGVDINIRNENGGTALMLSANKGNTELVKFLLEHGADPNIKSKNNGITALMLASYGGYIETVKLLLEGGADPNSQAINKETAILLSSLEGRTEIVKLLLEYGADPNIKSTQRYTGSTASELAQRKGHVEIARLLRKNFTINKKEIEKCEEHFDAIDSLDDVRKLNEVFMIKSGDILLCFSEGEIKVIQEALKKHNYDKELRTSLGRLGGFQLPEIDRTLMLFNEIMSIDL